MKVKILLIGICVASAAVFAAGKPEPRKKLTPEQIAANKERFLKRTGGIVEGETKGKYYLFVDATKGEKVDHSRTVSQVQMGCGIVAKCESANIANNAPFKYAKNLLSSRSDVGGITLIYDGSEDEPIESIYPMDKITLINATPLKKTKSNLYPKRINAMMWRGVSFNAGGVMPFGTECVMRNIFTVEDIDALKAVAAYPGVTQLVMNNAPIFEFAQKKRGLYYVACAEGWASEPTNDYQRVIWERAKAEQKQEPTKGLKIEFDPRKGK